MTRDTLDQIEEYITAQAPRHKQVVLAWLGGEPILCKDTVLEVSEMIQNLQKQHGFQYTAKMTTNGYLLDEKLFRQFVRQELPATKLHLMVGTMTRLGPMYLAKEPCGPSLTIWSLFPSCPRKSTPSISRYAVIFWPAMRTTVGTITFTVCLDRINASMYLFVQLVTGAAKAPTICHPFTRILKRCWLRSILHIWIKSGCCVIIKCTVSPVQIVLYSGPTGKLENVLRLLTVLNPS